LSAELTKNELLQTVFLAILPSGRVSSGLLHIYLLQLLHL